eukprot:GHVL01002553.1.p1 GENE.GHVL01002553.1~~GHVL01002553.1.p1  ORF type:complete len:300 (+),score=54.59 GHVL01002553.1:180-1079(+)
MNFRSFCKNTKRQTSVQNSPSIRLCRNRSTSPSPGGCTAPCFFELNRSSSIQFPVPHTSPRYPITRSGVQPFEGISTDEMIESIKDCYISEKNICESSTVTSSAGALAKFARMSSKSSNCRESESPSIHEHCIESIDRFCESSKRLRSSKQRRSIHNQPGVRVKSDRLHKWKQEQHVLFLRRMASYESNNLTSCPTETVAVATDSTPTNSDHSPKNIGYATPLKLESIIDDHKDEWSLSGIRPIFQNMPPIISTNPIVTPLSINPIMTQRSSSRSKSWHKPQQLTAYASSVHTCDIHFT